MRIGRSAGVQLVALALALAACGARSSLWSDAASSAATSTTSVGNGGVGGAGASSSSSASIGGTACVPISETCNGIDDDCDGEVDESDPGSGEPCSTGAEGVCDEGATGCVEGELACVPLVGPSPELCNGMDDDCNGAIDDGIVCVRRVFVTSQVYTGDLGGLSGADAKCQALADAAGLDGTFKAWLSDGTISARDRLSHAGAPYVLVDGVTVVAKNWAQLVDTHFGEPLDHAIDRTESMGPASSEGGQCGSHPAVWTGTQYDGTLYWAEGIGCPSKNCHSCENWTNTMAYGLAGDVSYTEGGWSNACQPVCSKSAALYCFEQ